MPKTLSDIRELQGVGEVEAAPPEDKTAPRRQRRPRPPAAPAAPVAEAGDPAPVQPQSSDRPAAAAAAQTADEEAGADADFVEPGFAPSDADASWPEAGLVSAAPVVPIASAGERAIADAPRRRGRRRSRIADGVALALLLSALGLGSSR